jgi:eukaryotic-like serine/threonine-protein kinase
MTRDSWQLDQGDRITSELTAMRLLGGGHAYEAYLAFDEVTYAPVVVKVVRPAQVTDEETLRGLRREVEALERTNHPALVRALRAEVTGDRPHLVLEQLDGPRLSTLVRKYGPLEPAQYLALGIEVASALHYLHRQGFVHLDVKPSNVIVGAPAKLIDLSLARTVEQASALTSTIGTDAFMAPEQTDPPRTGAPAPAADVWGLGATLFEAAAGYRAFDAGDLEHDAVERRYPQLVDEPYELPERVPHEVAKLIETMLAPRPEDRPAPAEVADVLGDVLERHPRGALGGWKVALSGR